MPQLTRDNVEEELTGALRRLCERTHDNACVLLEDRSTEKFVQFGRGPKLLLDLPLLGLSPEEKARALEAFESLGDFAHRTLAADDVNGEDVTREFEVAQFDFGQSAEQAAAGALRVFDRTYQLADVDFVLHEY